MLPTLFVIETSEIRWFYQGAIPESVLEWYDNCPGEKIAEPNRTDRYFVYVDNRAGIKIREGRIELKRLTGWTETFTVVMNHTAHREEWRKWSFRLASSNDPGRTGIDSIPDWIDVSKSRSLRIYQPTAEGKLVPKEFASSDSCQVELSRIKSNGGWWWSLGFESTGDAERRQRLLHLVAEKLLNRLRGVDLRDENCYGYPRWITKMYKLE